MKEGEEMGRKEKKRIESRRREYRAEVERGKELGTDGETEESCKTNLFKFQFDRYIILPLWGDSLSK